jgi:response regulator of citrate/malate metabolism
MKIKTIIKTINILLIDDDYITNLIHEKIIKSIENVASNIYSARNGAEALQVINDGKDLPDIIFLDLHMPVMGGFEFIEKFQKQWPAYQAKTKIVILSSSDDLRDIHTSKSLGISDFFTKPIPTKQMLSAIFKEDQIDVHTRPLRFGTGR